MVVASQRHCSQQTRHPQGRLIHAPFEAQVAQRPDAIALVFEGRHLSYDALNRRANQVAHYLRSLGVRAEDRVAICMERSLEMMVGLLGILKSGAAYVPLDPAYPDDRLAQMLGDSAPVALLTQASLETRLSALSPVRPVAMDETGDGGALPFARQSESNPDPVALGLNPGHLAYVIYTSGSTGRPKGVMVEHRNVTNLDEGISLLLAEAGIPAVRRCGWNASFAFDVSLQGLLQLGHGAELHVLGEDLRRDPAALLDYLQSRQIDLLDVTPLQADALLSVIGPGQVLPALVVAGEAIPPDLWRRLAEHHGVPGRAINAYGPTEATVYATATVISADTGPHIGRPLANLQCHVLDAHGAPLPEGLPGELHLGGTGVARGYLGQPALTAERFIADPFDASPGARLYRTGDIVRRRGDGQLEYLGRADGQVKVRGYRIELGEIEQRLGEQLGVTAAVVVAPTDRHGQRQLVGYAVLADGMVADPAWQSTTRQALRRVLPDYMVPQHLVGLDALPLNANGKLDRTRLPAPDQLVHQGKFVPLETASERKLAEIWAGLFGVDAKALGAAANFFLLGGHSLLLVRLSSSIRAVFGIEPSMQKLFDAADLRAMAKWIDDRGDADAGTIKLEETEW